MAQQDFSDLTESMSKIANASRTFAEGMDVFIKKTKDLLNELKADIILINTKLADQDKGMKGMRHDISGLGKEILRLDANQMARLANRNTIDEHSLLAPLRGVGNTEIANFPVTLGDFKNLEDDAVEALIAAFGIEVLPGMNMHAKFMALRTYFGLPNY